jgi:hypothetical protein
MSQRLVSITSCLLNHLVDWPLSCHLLLVHAFTTYVFCNNNLYFTAMHFSVLLTIATLLHTASIPLTRIIAVPQMFRALINVK